MKIALDAMGGDFGPPSLVAGAVLALREYRHVQKLFLVGDTAQIENELRNLYVLGFTPPEEARDGKFHQLAVKTAKDGVIVRARKGYASAPLN